VEALRLGLRGLGNDQISPMAKTLRHGAHFFIPLVALVAILALGYTPFRAAFFAIITLVVVAMFRTASRLDFSQIVETLILGAKNSIVIAISCGCAGIVVGVLDVTGVGIKFVTIVTELSMGILPLALVMAMMSCLILGMGVPTAPAYIIAAMIAAPALVKFGIQPIVAHMFVFYSALLSALTPPVALAAYAAAQISGGKVMSTAVHATKLGFVKFLVPYMFVYNPAFLMIGSPLFVIWSFFTALLGTGAMVVAMEGYFFSRVGLFHRLIFAVAGIAAIVPETSTDVVGLALFAVFGYLNYQKQVQEKGAYPAAASM
jgi:TRAP transporter 4TM/12TM fusion protein